VSVFKHSQTHSHTHTLTHMHTVMKSAAITVKISATKCRTVWLGLEATTVVPNLNPMLQVAD